MNKLLMLCAMMMLPVAGWAQKKAKKQVEPIKPMKEFVNELMGRMTLEEKIGQLNLQVAGDIVTGGAVNTDVGRRISNGQIGGVFNLKGADRIRELQDVAVKQSRLGIPLIIGMDVIHGYETVFPIPLALSCSWDEQAVEQSAHIAAKEASADGICWTFSPMVDICIDARWGRTAESNGEDPYLGSKLGQAMIRGYEGNALSSSEDILSCVKHYALYGGAEAGRDYNTVDMSHLRMYNQYFPPYKACAEAGAGSFMTSFNIVDGVPATANSWLINDVLRGQWGFEGMVVTDYGSINEMLQHGVGGDQKGASAMALKAGTDMDMCAEGFLNTLKQSYDDGTVSMRDIDKACRRILEAKYKLGLFQNPYKYCDASRRAKDIFTPENRKIARDITAETFVLLKNAGNILPLNQERKIALIGPLANDRANLSGTWAVAATPERYTTLKEAMEHRMGKGQLLYAQGCNICRDAEEQKAGEFGKNIPRVNDSQALQEALRIAREADVIVCAMGETADMSGEAASRSKLEIPDVQRELLAELVKTGKPVVLLHFSGRATVLTREQEHVDAFMNVWFGGSETSEAICDVLFGDKSPSGHLTVTMPQALGQVPIYYNHLNTGRPVPEGIDHFNKYASNYLDVRNDPLYPFGYGLSYTTFAYSDLVMSGKEMGVNGELTASVTVTNTGSRDADEVVQLYIRDLQASVSRPVKELKGFRRIHLKAGESQKVSFPITRNELFFYNACGQEVIEPGEFDIMVGSNSRDVQSARILVK